MSDERGGIDLGGTKIEAAVIGGDNKVVAQSRHPTPTDGGPTKVAEEMAAAMRLAAEQAGVKTTDLIGVGVGSPGEIDKRKGTVAQAKNLPDWNDPFPLADTLSEALGTPVK